ncbi:MBL fold metallo-hydrolase [uncultured Muriicola sp.]|uniref:MBL fold metallo-hydrolase n=1 Tax=uncultured Muriicola sp. TaxID=1583102 RepID=UPI002621DB50|nr:MBL fold metallo-hydrolase [uncultured Muriicola sp.]
MLWFLCALFLFSCKDIPNSLSDVSENKKSAPIGSSVKLVILGTVQDAGSPQIACEKDCCKDLQKYPDNTRNVVALGLVDGVHKKSYLIEATPNIGLQLNHLNELASFPSKPLPDGVFLTHAHIGHYTGLMYFGKESLNSEKLPVFVMPQMSSFLTQNGPWGQLVSNDNIVLKALEANKGIKLSSSLTVTPFLVPHRDEYSETVGFLIEGPDKKVLFIPDIDKWARWEKSIVRAISEVDYAFIDATFYDEKEINNRDISEIPHPFVIESMALFNDLTSAEKGKIYFTHFNHTNPLLTPESEEYKDVVSKGFHVASFLEEFEL